jgi:glutaredoxin
MKTLPRILVALVLALFVGLALGACHKKPTDEAGNATIVVKDDSQGLLLTWIDEKGDFHVEQKVTDVPLVGRDAVRVVDPENTEGTHADKVFVADLRNKNADGTYPVKVMTRADFDKLAVDRREKHGPTLASASPSASASGAPTNANTGGGGGGHDPGIARPPVIIYGASWCGACHEAAAYLRKKGIPYVEKDVEKDASANEEMKAKLRRFGLPNGSIPVIDVRGKVMVGFDPNEVDDALGKAL